MVFAIHKRYSIPKSRIREKSNVGLEEKYQTKYEGVDLLKDDEGRFSQHNRYQKNYARMMGMCIRCKDFIVKKKMTVDGSHCGRKICDK